MIKVLLYFGRQQSYNKQLGRKQHTTHSNPIKIQLLMKHTPTIISQSIGGSSIFSIFLKTKLKVNFNITLILALKYQSITFIFNYTYNAKINL